MKIYSYLGSGVPVIATNLPTHTQVISTDTGRLCNPNARDMAEAMHELMRSPEDRKKLASGAIELIKSEHSSEAFQKQLNNIYKRISEQNVCS